MQNFVQLDRGVDSALVKTVANENNISPLLAYVLCSRGLTEKNEIHRFLHPELSHMHNPMLLPDIELVIERIRYAIDNSERIVVYGDYDVDGICATAIIVKHLSSCGADVGYYLPSRHNEGYGLNNDAILELYNNGARLIVTTDNGIASIDEIEYAKSLSIDVIVTDHHQCGDVLPDCVAVVNPKRADSKYPFVELCGAGIALKLVEAMGADIKHYLPLAALATVADIVPLVNENRVIVANGITGICDNIGLHALAQVAGSSQDDITSETLAFFIAPRLNAAGRMGDAMRGLHLLLCDDATEAKNIALDLNDENAERQKEERSVISEARNMLLCENIAKTRAILLYSDSWNSGVLGIAASKLAGDYSRPTLLFRRDGDVLTGSCRSIHGINLYECLSKFSTYFERFGGHAQAAGVTMKLDSFESFKTVFLNYLASEFSFETFYPQKAYDKQLNINEFTIRDIKDLKLLEPFGEGNKAPIYMASDVSLKNIERIGKDKSHLSARVLSGKTSLKLIAFSMGDKYNEVIESKTVDLLYSPDVNLWQGSEYLQLKAHSIKPENPLKKVARGEEDVYYDMFFYNYLSSANGDMKPGLLDVNLINNIDEEIVKSIKGNIASTLILCYTPNGAKRINKVLIKAGIGHRIQVFNTGLPVNTLKYHTLLLAPMHRALSFEGFNNVFVYDMPLELLSLPVIQDDKQVFVNECSKKSSLFADEFLPHSNFDRGVMAKIYSMLVNILGDKEMTKTYVTDKCREFGFGLVTLALAVFVELGFILWDEKTGILSLMKNAPTRKLDESKLYSVITKNNCSTAAM